MEVGDMKKASDTSDSKGAIGYSEILSQNRALKVSDFHLIDLEALAKDLKIGKRTLLKEINLFRDTLKKHDWIEESEGKLFLYKIAIKLISLARCARKNKISDPQDIRIIALSNLVDDLTKTSVPEEEYMNEVRERKELSSKISSLKRRNTDLRHEIETLNDQSRRAQLRIEKFMKEVEALKHLITAMTYSQVVEREELLKEFVGGQVGTIVNNVVWRRNS